MSGIIVEGASKRFGSVKALQDVSFSALPGEFVVLLGPSGSGKTTLLRALAGLEPLDAGTIQLGEKLVEDARSGLRLPSEARGLGMVFQEYALWPHLSTFENVALPLRERRLSDWKARALEALERVGLPAHAARFAYELSGGQQQRVALARALAGRPEVLLFDEPLSNLDAQLREELRLEIARLTREYAITSVYITHDQSEAFFLADRLGVMSAGQLVQFDSAEAVYERPASPFVARFTGAMGGLEGVLEAGTVRFGSSPNASGSVPVEVYLRPEGLEIVLAPAPDALLATVEHAAYVGGRYQCWLALGGGRVLAWHTQRLKPKDRVWVRARAGYLHAFDASTQANTGHHTISGMDAAYAQQEAGGTQWK